MRIKDEPMFSLDMFQNVFSRPVAVKTTGSSSCFMPINADDDDR